MFVSEQHAVPSHKNRNRFQPHMNFNEHIKSVICRHCEIASISTDSHEHTSTLPFQQIGIEASSLILGQTSLFEHLPTVYFTLLAGDP